MITMKICMSYKINKVDPVIGPNVWRRLSPIRVIAREQPFSDHQPSTPYRQTVSQTWILSI